MTATALAWRMLSHPHSRQALRMCLEAQGSGLFVPFRPLSAIGKVFCYRQNS